MKEDAMKVKVIVNPKSKHGDHKSILATLKARLARSLVDIEQTAYPQHATEIARQIAKTGMDTVVVVGGDGTINEVLNGLVGTDTALGIIPTGTANDLACFSHIPTDVAGACNTILERRIHRTDIICVNGRCYVTAGGVGLPCEVARVANTIKRSSAIGKRLGQILGSKLYILAVFCALVQKKVQRNFLSIQWSGGSLRVDPLWLMVDNQPFLGENFLMSPGALNDDGAFDICLIEDLKSRMQILKLMMVVLKGRHVDSPSVKTWRTSELLIDAEKPLTFFGDGEIFQKVKTYRIQIFPSALNVIVPKAI